MSGRLFIVQARTILADAHLNACIDLWIMLTFSLRLLRGCRDGTSLSFGAELKF